MSDCSSSIQLLCDHGASVNSKDGVSCCLLHFPVQTLLEYLCFSCFLSLSLFLLLSLQDGRTPLVLATQMCRPMVCQLLIDRGADVNARDKQNR